jgi:hypothetical protein
MHKKAQGMSINTLIIAILVLVVLVVLVLIFTGYIGGWSKGVAQNSKTCGSQGGTCITGTDCKSIFHVGLATGNDIKKADPNMCFDQGSQTPNTENCCPGGYTENVA